MTSKVQLVRAATLACAWALACTGREPTAPAAVSQSGFAATITCQASVRTPVLSCGDAAPVAPNGINASVILGGQGTYVLLASSGTAYNALTQAFTSNVTVKNLTVQPMNTPDGTTVDTGGIKVFFQAGPTTTLGSGSVTVNADGTGTFTGTGQPFYKYTPGVLASNATTAPKTWSFTVPNTVLTFSFSVFVTTKLPADSAVLRWVQVAGPTTRPLRSASGVGNTVWAVGDSGTILFYNGTSWSSVATGLSLGKLNLYGTQRSGGGMYAVGDSGVIVHNNGVSWSRAASGVTTTLFAINKRPPTAPGDTNSVWAVGVGGVILHSVDGTTWAAQASGVTDSLFTTGGPAENNWFAGGQAGRGLHWNGTTWSPLTSNTTKDIYAGGAGDSLGTLKLWLAGNGGTLVHSGDGGVTWVVQSSPTTQNLYGLAGQSLSDIYVVGAAGTIIHWNGSSWSFMASGTTADLLAVAPPPAGTPPGPPDIWVVGVGGIMLHGIR